ncbi:MAG: hypothetical protein GXO25_02550 [Euryarchaeota archaeon]|nr:hypothetical protein [Euryarchaeota archaeon]
MNVISKFLQRIESHPVPLWVWLLEITFVAALRHWCESLIYHYKLDPAIYFHGVFYFIFIFSFVLLVIKIVTRERINRILAGFALFTPVILLPPLVDHYIFGRTVGYDYPTLNNWTTIAFSFFQKYVEIPSHGFQIEFLLLFGGIWIYLTYKIKLKNGSFRILVSSVLVFLLYLSVIFISIPEASLIFRVFTEGADDIWYSNFYYWVLILRYLFLAGLFIFVSCVIEYRGKIRWFFGSRLLSRAVSMSAIYLIGFGVSQYTLNWELVPGRLNLIVLILGLMGVFSASFFVFGILNYRRETMDLVNILSHNKQNTYRDFKSFFFTAAIFGALSFLPQGTTIFLMYMLFIAAGIVFFYIPLSGEKTFEDIGLLVICGALSFSIGYEAPLFSRYVTLSLYFWGFLAGIIIMIIIGYKIVEKMFKKL